MQLIFNTFFLEEKFKKSGDAFNANWNNNSTLWKVVFYGYQIDIESYPTYRIYVITLDNIKNWSCLIRHFNFFWQFQAID